LQIAREDQIAVFRSRLVAGKEVIELGFELRCVLRIAHAISPPV
jgi:hypothetical protein